MRPMNRYLPIFIAAALALTSCYQPASRATFAIPTANETDTAAANMSQQLQRAYGVGYNFVVDADSLVIIEERPMHWSEGAVDASDSLWLRHGDAVVVAAFLVIPEDSIDSVWVKVAHDQQTMGWLHETTLLDTAYPDDPISAFIYLFSSHRWMWFLLTLAVVAVTVAVRLLRRKYTHFVHIADIPSAYPTLLILTLSVSSLLYGYIQHYCPQVWVRFYFHPTLNPLAQPWLICFFLSGLWLLLLLAIATANNAFSYLRPKEAVIYLITLAGVCVVIYLVFSLTASSAFGYILFIVYSIFALYRYWRYARARYLCGNCGAKLRSKGVCPKCGAVND